MSGMRNLGLWRVGRRRGSWNYCVCIGEKEGDSFLGEMGCKEEISGVGVEIFCYVEVERIAWITLLDMQVLSDRNYSTRG
jgi:hypothetical protein